MFDLFSYFSGFRSNCWIAYNMEYEDEIDFSVLGNNVKIETDE